MTYFGFLAIFLLPPLVVLAYQTWLDFQRGKQMPEALSSWPLRKVIFAHVLIALVYTTPWDNYLVATQVWWYDPQLVTGLTIGWVPIEEYTFFVLQSLVVGLWVGFLARQGNQLLVPAPAREVTNQVFVRRGSVIIVLPAWLWSLVVLILGWQPGTYLALILIWALPPIMLQLYFGADILWKYRRLAITAIASATLYLGAADLLAIQAGTWTISPNKTLGASLAGILPVEELVFFFLTCVLIVFGMVLVLARESQQRVPARVSNSLPLRSQY